MTDAMTLPTMIRRVDERKAAIDALRPLDWEQEQRIMQKFHLSKQESYRVML